MIDSDMNQIRELLLGEFESKTKNEFKSIYRELSEIKEKNQQDMDKLNKSLQQKYQYLENSINTQLNSQQKINSDKFKSIEKEILIQQEYNNKVFNTLKKQFEKRLNSLKEDYTQKNVSKESMASMFFEYALKLKDESIEDKLKKNIK